MRIYEVLEEAAVQLAETGDTSQYGVTEIGALAQFSIAISLKRIADRLDDITQSKHVTARALRVWLDEN